MIEVLLPLQRERLTNVYLDDPDAPWPGRWGRQRLTVPGASASATAAETPADAPHPSSGSSSSSGKVRFLPTPPIPKPKAAPSELTAPASDRPDKPAEPPRLLTPARPGSAALIPASRLKSRDDESVTALARLEQQLQDEQLAFEQQLASLRASHEHQVRDSNKQLEEQRTQLQAERQQGESRRQKIEELQAQLLREKEDRGAIELTLAGMAQAAHALRSQQTELIEEFRTATKQIAVAIATRLLHTKLEAGDVQLENLVAAAVKRLDSNERVMVRMHPEDLRLLRLRVSDLEASLGSDIEVVGDATLNRGDCVASDGEITVASRMDESLAELSRQVMAS